MRNFWQFIRRNFRPEVDTDVIWGVAVDHVSVSVPVKLGDLSDSTDVADTGLGKMVCYIYVTCTYR